MSSYGACSLRDCCELMVRLSTLLRTGEHDVEKVQVFWLFALMIDDLSDFWNAFVHCSRATLHWAYATVYSAWAGFAIHQTHG